MKVRFTLQLIFILFLGAGIAFGQLQPVQIFPLEKEKKTSDEELAHQYFRDKEFEKAAQLYSELYDENSLFIYYNNLLFCYLELSDYQTAEKLVKTAKRKNTQSSRYLVDLGYIYTHSGELNKAKKQYEAAIKELQPVRYQVVDLANSFIQRREDAYAVQTYLEARKIIPDESFGIELATVYSRMGKYEEMIDEYLDYLFNDVSVIRTVQGRLQNELRKDKEGLLGEAIKYALLKRIQKTPEKAYYSEMLIWLSIQNKDFETALSQAKSLDRRYGESGQRVLDLAEIISANTDFDLAIDAYKYVLKKGSENKLYLSAKAGILNARYLKITSGHSHSKNDLLALENDYLSAIEEFGNKASTFSISLSLAHLQAFYLDKIDEAVNRLNSLIAIPNLNPNLKANCKLELADILLFKEDIWEASLLYSQVEKDFKNDPIGYLAKYKNAKLFYYAGDFEWAKAQLDVLKAATSKLIANDALDLSLLISDNMDNDSVDKALKIYSRADLLLYRNKEAEALQTLDSILSLASWHPIFDEVLFKKAEIFQKQGKFHIADSLLMMIINNYGYDILADDAIFLRATINLEKLNKVETAKALYENLILNYPGSLYVVEARKKFRKLRGDSYQ
jgi:tetratricopeptide (TPR) repeat protein